MNILVSGGGGQLSKSLFEVTKFSKINFIYLPKEKLNIADSRSISKQFNIYKPTYFINTAALTNVDFCELYPHQALQINSTSIINIINQCIRYNTKLIHISSDYLYASSKNIIKQNKTPIPENIYGYSKLLAEKYITQFYNNASMIIRPSWLFSPYGKNFIHHVINAYKEKNIFKLYDNIVGSPTSCNSLAVFISNFIESNSFKNLKINFNQGKLMSRYQFAKKIVNLMEKYVVKDKNFEIVIDKIQKPIAKRPEKLFLDNSILKKNFKSHYLNCFDNDLETTIKKIISDK